MIRDPKTVIPVVTTQRAYTLRLRGVDPSDLAWRDALWATHEAINLGAKAFGDWLLTLRGGLSHELAESRDSDGHKPTDEQVRDRRILLALSWLSVESAPVDDRDPRRRFVLFWGKDARTTKASSAHNSEMTLRLALRGVLRKRGVTDAAIGDPGQQDEKQMDSWFGQCGPALAARIREDAVWVDRSSMFDALTAGWDEQLARVDAHTLTAFILKPDFLTLPTSKKSATKKDAGAGEEAHERRDREDAVKASSKGAGQRTRHPFSHLFGEGKPFGSPKQSLVLRAKWHDDLKPRVEASGIPVLPVVRGQKKQRGSGPAHTELLREMFSKAASRVAQIVTKQRQQEADRLVRKNADAELAAMERDRSLSAALEALDQYCLEYGDATQTIGEFRLRPRQLAGWERVVKWWGSITEHDPELAWKTRIDAVKSVQRTDEDSRFGDASLFFRLAEQRFTAVWSHSGKSDHTILERFVKGMKARSDSERLRIAAYRHPDAYLNPIFCQFGVSRPAIRFRRLGPFTEAPGGDDPRAVGMLLWHPNAQAAQLTVLHAVSRRVDREIGSARDSVQAGADALPEVPRHGRLGAAAGGLAVATAPSKVAGVFDMKAISSRATDEQADEDGGADRLKEPTWNGTLSTRRRDLVAIRQCLDRGDEQRARKRRTQLRWTLTVSMEMEGRGPWPRYVVAASDQTPFKLTVRKDEPIDRKDLARGLKRKMGATTIDAVKWPWEEFNCPLKRSKAGTALEPDRRRQRGGNARLLLSRLPGLRILGVDLGHRFAAACGVWESLSAVTMKQETAGRAIVACESGNGDLHLHTCHVDPKTGKDRTTIYRRIGMDTLADGSPHPAPWARLNRQFLIKLQGEEAPARAASSRAEHGVNEVAFVAGLAQSIGLITDTNGSADGRAVDELMRRAVSVATTGLKRHARVAKIAYAMNPECLGIPGVGGSLKPLTRGDESHIRFLIDALFDWHALATDAEWDGAAYRKLWNAHIAQLPSGFRVETPNASSSEPRTRQQQADDEFRGVRLKPLAENIDQAGAKAMFVEWKRLWELGDGSPAIVPKVPKGQQGPAKTTVSVPAAGWHAHLRALSDWIMGRGLVGAESRGWTRNVGGLGLTRIGTMRSLYQLHKAFQMRARPERVQGAPDRGEDNSGVAMSILNAMARMREQRVKQLASRIVEAALGVGRHTPAKERARDRSRPSEQCDQPCHAVVIENLRNYQPDELQTRRENKALMSWSSGKVRKYLEEGCQLHGLHLREVMPNYTSRQCSRTGLPGMRCTDVPVSNFLETRYWTKVVASARGRLSAGGDDSLDLMLRDLHERWSRASEVERVAQGTIRIPRNGADLFVNAPRGRVETGVSRRAAQADLNAAANIGLRALLDPDFIGKWWYVPCDSATGKPAGDRCAGAACLDHGAELIAAASSDDKVRRGRNRGKGSGEEVTNAWRDVGDSGAWRVHAAYWGDVKARIVKRLRGINGLSTESASERVAAGGASV